MKGKGKINANNKKEWVNGSRVETGKDEAAKLRLGWADFFPIDL